MWLDLQWAGLYALGHVCVHACTGVGLESPPVIALEPLVLFLKQISVSKSCCCIIPPICINFSFLSYTM